MSIVNNNVCAFISTSGLLLAEEPVSYGVLAAYFRSASEAEYSLMFAIVE